MYQKRLTQKEIDELILMKHKKRIKNVEIAATINKSTTHISRIFLNEGTASIETEQAVANFIREY